MRRIAIISSRHRGWNSRIPASAQLGSETDRARAETLIEELSKKWNGVLVVGIGADAGLNRSIRGICEDLHVPYLEVRVTFTEQVHPAILELALLSRHEAVAAICHEAIILQGKGKVGHVEDLLHVLRRHRIPYVVYDESWNLVESHEKESAEKGTL